MESVDVPSVKGHAWKGGRNRMSNGYIRVWCPGHPAAGRDGYALEHRRVMMDAGAQIPDGWHIHHMNGQRDDNRLINLALRAPGRHRELHIGDTVQNQYGEWPVFRNDKLRGRLYRIKNRETILANHRRHREKKRRAAQ